MAEKDYFPKAHERGSKLLNVFICQILNMFAIMWNVAYGIYDPVAFYRPDYKWNAYIECMLHIFNAHIQQ